MPLHSSRFVALSGAAALLLAAGCSSPKPKGHAGGTLHVLQQTDFEHLDPGRATTPAEADFGRLLYRTLTSYDYSSNGGVHLVPDLATSTGTPSADATSWTFTLRRGLEYQDGTVITAEDVKRGVERSRADSPLRVRLTSVEAPDPVTVIFTFASSYPDFPYAAALPATAPVPAGASTDDTHIVSSGPYQISSYVRNVALTLVRNPHWVAKTDPARKAFPDRVEATFGTRASSIDARLVSDRGPDREAVSLSPVLPQDVDDALQRAKKRSQNGFDNGVSYFSFNPGTASLRDVRVRQALQYAYPHVEVRQTEGGVTAADIATGIIAPSLDGYDKRDLYKTKDQNGDPATTRQLLAEAGVRDLSLTLDVPETPEALVTAAVVAAAYRQAGVTLTVVPGRSGATRADLTLVEHLPVLPTAEGVISMLDDCALCDPTLQVLRQQALAETDLKKADKLFAKVDEMVMEQALVLPRYFTKTLTVHGSAVRNTTPAAGYAGLPDLVNLAVR